MILNCCQVLSSSVYSPTTHVIFLGNKSNTNFHIYTLFDYGIDSLILVNHGCIDYSPYSAYGKCWRVKCDNTMTKKENKFISWFKSIYSKFVI